MNRIQDKIDQLEAFLGELESIAPNTFEEYNSNIEKKAACERYAEKIVEAAIDLAFFMIKSRRLRIPESDTDAFNILAESKLIDDALAANLKKAKGMRNIIAHEYGEIDNKVVFEAINNKLKIDVEKLIRIAKASKK